MSTDYPSDWNSRRKTVYQRDNYTCQNCGVMGGPQGQAELHAHHIVPKSRGGTHATSNLISLCSECHNTVHSKSKQAPTSHQQPIDSGLDYGQISDAIVEDITTLSSIMAEVTTVHYDSLHQQTNELERVAIELRPFIMQITDAIETLDTISSRNYPPELVEHDKKTFEHATKCMMLSLKWLKYRSGQIGDLVEEIYSCPKCDEAVDVEEQDFCSNCGTKLQLGPSCPSCGEEVFGTDKFCSSCGESVDGIEDQRGIGKKAEEIKEDMEKKEEYLSKYIDKLSEMVGERSRIINQHSKH